MFDLGDIIPDALWPANWTWWWILFAPCMGFAIVLWMIGITGSGWLICTVMAIFVFLSIEFCADLWKVLMRAGMALTTTALVVLTAASVLMGRGAPAPSEAAQSLTQMSALGFVPFMLTGFIMCALGGILALTQSDQ